MIREKSRKNSDGKILLSEVHSESGNEQWDEWEILELEAAGTDIVFVKTLREKNAINSSDSVTTERYRIPIVGLVDFIVSSGEEVKS